MKIKNKKLITFICALILLLTSTFTNLKIISAVVYASTEDLFENLIENQDIEENYSSNNINEQIEEKHSSENIDEEIEENYSLDNTNEEIEESSFLDSTDEEMEEELDREELTSDFLLTKDDEIMFYANPGASSSVQYHGSVSYGGSKVGHFSIDGKIAFCMHHSKKTPPTGTGVISSIYDNINIAKCLYFGWGGDAQWGGFTSESMGIVMTSLALDYFYVGNNHKVANSFINFVNSQELPVLKLSFSNPHMTGHVVGDQQATEAITLFGDSRYSISFALQPGVQLHNMTKGIIYTDRAVLNGGDSFFLAAPLDINPSWTSENISQTAYKYSNIIWSTGNSNYQPLGQYSIEIDPEYYINLSVNWETVSNKGSLEIVKTDETGNLLDGAKVKITTDNGYSNENVLVTGGKIVINELEPGNYTVQEIEAPEGYQIDETPFDIEVKAGQTASVTILNGAIPPPTAEIGIVKTNEDGSAPVAGALFRVWNDGEYSETFRTDTSGKINIEGLETGNYYYQEISAPYGYLLNDTIHTLTFSNEGGDSSNLISSETLINIEPTRKFNYN